MKHTTEYEQRQLNHTSRFWRDQTRKEVDNALAKRPQETSNEGPGITIGELLGEDG